MKLRGLYRKSDTSIYYYQPSMVKGIRPKPISLETKDEKEAVQKYHAVAIESAREFASGSVRMEAARFLEIRKKEGGHTERTSQESEMVIDAFLDCIGNAPISAIDCGHVQRFKNTLTARSLSPATVRSQLGRLSAFFTWAVRDGLIEKNPVHGVDLPRTLATRSERYCTKEEREKLLQTLPDDRPDLALVFHVGFFAGLRKQEIIEARRDWVDLEAGVLTVRNTDSFTSKDKQHRLIRMSPRLVDFLTSYLDALDPADAMVSGYLLRPDKAGRKAWRYRFDPRNSFKSHCRDQGLGWVTFHTMRHTFATLHALARTPLTTIARELGDDPETTFRNYVGYTRHGDHAAAID